MTIRHFNPVHAWASVEPGTILGGYQLIKLLGEGGMGAVFLARNIRLEKMVRAIKIIRPELAGTADSRERFLREAECLEALQHPNILRVETIGEESGILYMVMELLRGESADALLARREGRLPLEVAVEIIHQALEGVSHAHTHGVIHRDLKPANLFITSQGLVKLIDFGIAKQQAAPGSLTQGAPGMPGSPAYYAPELADGAAPSPASDIYALGISLFELLAGRPPFQTGGGTDAQVAVSLLVQHATKPLPDPRASRPEIPEPLVAALARASAKKAEERYPDAAAFARDLLPFKGAGGLNDVARPAEPATEAPAAAPVTAGTATTFHVPMTGASRRPAPASPTSTQFVIPASGPRPDPHEKGQAPRLQVRGHRTPLVLGLALAALAIMAGGAFASMNRHSGQGGSEPGHAVSSANNAPQIRPPGDFGDPTSPDAGPSTPPETKSRAQGLRRDVSSAAAARNYCLAGDAASCVRLCEGAVTECLDVANALWAQRQKRVMGMYQKVCETGALGAASACGRLSHAFACGTLGRRDLAQAARYHARTCELRRTEVCDDFPPRCAG